MPARMTANFGFTNMRSQSNTGVDKPSANFGIQNDDEYTASGQDSVLITDPSILSQPLLNSVLK